ncbi:hypothetical protein TNCT_321141, partial [Trichonephila clavata]
VQEWINNLNLEDNLPNYISEDNGDREIDSPIAISDNTESANKLSIVVAEKPKTPKQHCSFKLSTISLSQEKTDSLLDTSKESSVDTSNKSSFNDKGVAIHFNNADFEADEPELIETFKNAIDVKDQFPVFNENYHLLSDFNGGNTKRCCC